jgi:hypothetical protein
MSQTSIEAGKNTNQLEVTTQEVLVGAVRSMLSHKEADRATLAKRIHDKADRLVGVGEINIPFDEWRRRLETAEDLAENTLGVIFPEVLPSRDVTPEVGDIFNGYRVLLAALGTVVGENRQGVLSALSLGAKRAGVDQGSHLISRLADVIAPEPRSEK